MRNRRVTNGIRSISLILATGMIACLAAGCAAPAPDDEVDRPVTEEEAQAVAESLGGAVPGNMIRLQLISGETVDGGFVALTDAAVTLSHPGDHVPERRTYQLRYVRRADVIVMRSDTLE